MGATTGIEWTDATWNPIRGCSRVSEGCRNCYAEKVAYRFSGAGQPYEGLAHKVNGHAAWTGKVALAEDHLLDPLKWGGVALNGEEELVADAMRRVYGARERRIFVNSMSDLFHENVPDEWIDKIFAVMALCPQHQFQVLTKRPARMLKYFCAVETAEQMPAADRIAGRLHDVHGWTDSNAYALQWPLPNVWLGVSVENQAAADERIPLLLQTPAAVRFISAEPLLGPVRPWLAIDQSGALVYEYKSLPDMTQATIDWVIVGGESGPGARPMKPEWARRLRDQCEAAGVPFFFKQWGEWMGVSAVAKKDGIQLEPGISLKSLESIQKWDGDLHRGYAQNEMTASFLQAESQYSVRVGKKAAGSLLDGREWKEFPEGSNF